MNTHESHAQGVDSQAWAAIAAMLVVTLLFLAIGLWLVFGGDVFARMGATVWALCF